MIILTLLAASAVPGARENPVIPETPIAKRLRQGNISDHDYPVGKVPKGFTGSAVVAILIDPNGKVVQCRTESSSGNALLDDRACTLVAKRFRYKPYLTEDGTPAWVADKVTVHWVPPRY